MAYKELKILIYFEVNDYVYLSYAYTAHFSI